MTSFLCPYATVITIILALSLVPPTSIFLYDKVLSNIPPTRQRHIVDITYSPIRTLVLAAVLREGVLEKMHELPGRFHSISKLAADLDLDEELLRDAFAVLVTMHLATFASSSSGSGEQLVALTSTAKDHLLMSSGSRSQEQYVNTILLQSESLFARQFSLRKPQKQGERNDVSIDDEKRLRLLAAHFTYEQDVEAGLVAAMTMEKRKISLMSPSPVVVAVKETTTSSSDTANAPIETILGEKERSSDQSADLLDAVAVNVFVPFAGSGGAAAGFAHGAPPATKLWFADESDEILTVAKHHIESKHPIILDRCNFLLRGSSDGGLLSPPKLFDVVIAARFLTQRSLANASAMITDSDLYKKRLRPGGWLVIIDTLRDHEKLPSLMELTAPLHIAHNAFLRATTNGGGEQLSGKAHTVAQVKAMLQSIGFESLWVKQMQPRPDVVVLARKPLDD